MRRLSVFESRGAARGASGLVPDETVASHGKRPDDQDADDPHHDGDEDRYHIDQRLGVEYRRALYIVSHNRHGNAPPGENGVHRRRQQPGAKQIPDFFRLVIALLGGEEATQTQPSRLANTA